MTAKRQTITDNAVTLLQATSTLGSNVFPSRVYPIEQDDLPAAKVYYGEETLLDEQQTIDPPWIRSLLLNVEVVTLQNTGMEDTLDQVMYEIEQAFLGDRTLSGTVINTMYAGTSEPELSGEGEKPAVSMIVTHEVIYEQ